jgi:GH24 family phage-related lysozyme (muramidase)
MYISQAGIDLITSFEGCELTAYWDSTGEVWTIGYGHTGSDVFQGLVITQTQAEEFLSDDLAYFCSHVDTYTLDYNWTQNEFDALVSFAYNVGNIDELTNNGLLTKPEIADDMLLYIYSGGVILEGLVRRREAEKAMFLSGGITLPPEVISGVIDMYCQFMIDMANDNSHGYSQVERSLYNYIDPTSFDCSSLVLTAIQYAFDVYKITPTPEASGCSNTSNMLDLESCGFEIIEENPLNDVDAIKGDIELTPSAHTACYIGEGKVVQASTDNGTTNTIDDAGNEINIHNWYSFPWDYRLRFTGKGVTGEIIPPVDPPKKKKKSKVFLFIKKRRRFI